MQDYDEYISDCDRCGDDTPNGSSAGRCAHCGVELFYMDGYVVDDPTYPSPLPHPCTDEYDPSWDDESEDDDWDDCDRCGDDTPNGHGHYVNDDTERVCGDCYDKEAFR